jgi:hypothetical protein
LGTATDADSIGDYTSALTIGDHAALTANNNLSGWIKELRISNVARTITVPTTQYSSDANTKLLLHFDTPATAPLAPAIKFDGTGDYLTVADHADWDFGTGDFTIEYWVRFNAISTQPTMIDLNGYAAGVTVTYFVTQTLYTYIVGSAVIFTGWAPAINIWYHVALCRSGTDIRAFINGTQIGSTLANSANITGGTGGVKIGSPLGLAIDEFNGRMKNIRISNIARYTTAFTPSQTPFTADANTKLLILGNEANGAVAFTDSETTPKNITTAGDTKISYEVDYRETIFKDDGNTGHFPYPTGKAKVDFLSAFGNGVMTLDGTGDYLTLLDHANWDFGTGDFTLETWVRFNSVASATFIDMDYTARPYLTYAGNQVDAYLGGTAIGTSGSWAWTPLVYIWYHVVFVRVSGVCKCFINGTKIGNDVNDSHDVSSSSPVWIGARQDSTCLLNGMMDNVIISNNARYTATFNPPKEDFGPSGLGRMFIVF